MSLASIVELYRICGKPQLVGAVFTGTASFQAVRDLVLKIQGDRRQTFEDLKVDGNDLPDDDELPTQGHTISFTLRITTGTAATFQADLGSLLAKDPKISRGELPAEFYLVDIDYFSGDTTKPPQMQALDKICKLIQSISKLAHYHDDKSGSGYLRMVFIQPAKNINTFKPVELETRVTTTVIQAAENLDTRIVEDLSESSASNDPHYTSKVGVFGTCLANFVSNRPSGDAFEYLVSHWHDFTNEYHRDLSTYLSGFAFHKAKTEVAEAEIKIAGEFSKVIGDISGKLIGIPVSYAVIAAIPKAETFAEQLLIFIGISVASLIIAKTVDNQERQFIRIQNAKNLIINSIQGKKQTYPKDLADTVDKLVNDLNQDEAGLTKSLRLFKSLCWSPIAISVLVLCYLYLDTFYQYALAIIDMALCYYLFGRPII